MLDGDAYYHRSLHQSAEQKRRKDALRQACLEALGYEVHAFWEYDIRHNPEEVRREVIAILTKSERDRGDVHAD